MKYKVSFKLINPEKTRSFMVKGVVEIEKSGAFAYGNGKYMHIDFSESREVMKSDLTYDIRYDTRYNSADEVGYIKTFVKDNWSGQNGSWKAQYVTVKKVFELERKRSTLTEQDKEEIRSLIHQKQSIRNICTTLKIYRKPVEEFLLSEGLIDTSVCKYYH